MITSIEMKADPRSGVMATNYPRTISPYGVPLAQTWENVIGHLYILGKFDIKLFVELGVYLGGLTSIIIPLLDYIPDAAYLGVDNGGQLDGRVAAAMSRYGVRAEIIKADIFSSLVTERVRAAIIRCPGRALIFCDGGDKPKEIVTYKELLRKNDLISVHDYKPDSIAPVNDNLIGSFSDTLSEVNPTLFKSQLHLPLFIKI